METLTLALNNNYSLEKENELVINEELIASYKKNLDTKPSTAKTYLICIDKFNNWLTNNNVTEITKETFIAYKSYLKEHTEYNEETKQIENYSLNSNSINLHISALKNFFNYLEEDLGVKNIAKKIKKERTSKVFVREPLSLNQVKSILNSIDTSTLDGARTYAIFKLLVGTGLRQCEVIRANIEDIKVKGNKNVLYVLGKGETQKYEYVELKPSVYQAIQNYLIKRGNAKPSEPLFTSMSDRNKGQRLTTRTIQKLVKDLYKANGIVSNNITTHSTRHFLATESIINGATLQQVQATLRHKNILTTTRYFHDIERLSNSNVESKIEELINE